MTYHESSNGGATVASVTRENIEDGIARARRLRAQFFTDAIRVVAAGSVIVAMILAARIAGATKRALNGERSYGDAKVAG